MKTENKNITKTYIKENIIIYKSKELVGKKILASFFKFRM